MLTILFGIWQKQICRKGVLLRAAICEYEQPGRGGQLCVFQCCKLHSWGSRRRCIVASLVPEVSEENQPTKVLNMKALRPPERRKPLNQCHSFTPNSTTSVLILDSLTAVCLGVLPGDWFLRPEQTAFCKTEQTASCKPEQTASLHQNRELPVNQNRQPPVNQKRQLPVNQNRQLPVNQNRQLPVNQNRPLP